MAGILDFLALRANEILTMNPTATSRRLVPSTRINSGQQSVTQASACPGARRAYQACGGPTTADLSSAVASISNLKFPISNCYFSRRECRRLPQRRHRRIRQRIRQHRHHRRILVQFSRLHFVKRIRRSVAQASACDAGSRPRQFTLYRGAATAESASAYANTAITAAFSFNSRGSTLSNVSAAQ